MSARFVHVGMWLDGRELDLVATSVQLAVNVARSNPDGAAVSRELLMLLDRMREACSMSCATQSAQLARDCDSEEWQPTDLITVKEAAAIMKCSEANVRARCGRRSLWSVKIGGQYRLSRADVLTPGRRAG